jgi:transposase
VWIQHFYVDDGRVCLREKKDQPPAARLITSPYDPEARCSTKRDTTWIGYKTHLTETCDVDTPSLIINVETRPATEPDHDVTGIIHDHLVEKGYGPAEHFVDQGYMSVDHLVRAQADADIDLMGAVPDDNSWQARQGGHDSRRFIIDWDNERAICPQGHTSCSWSLAHTRSQRPVVKIKFRHVDCATCPVIALCTDNREKRRTLTILAPQTHFQAQQDARQRQQTAAFKDACTVRAGVEGTISQVACALGARRSRYRGIDKTHLQHLGVAAAINLLRVVDWLNEVPRAKTPKSRFARLAA